MLNEVGEGVWVRQSDWVWTNSTVVRTDDGLILVDPGITGPELEALADDIERLGIPVVAGFSTHADFDHVLWHPRFGDVPRYATAKAARVAAETLEREREAAAEHAPGAPLEQVGLITPIPADGGPVPGELIEHRAHAVGHTAVLLADRGVLLAGDMLSDILLPIFDTTQDGQVSAFEEALDLLAGPVEQADVLIPGHGAVAKGPEAKARWEADRAYISAIRDGAEPEDARLEEDWVVGIHEGNLKLA